MFQTIVIDKTTDGILQVILSRPEALNALNARMFDELRTIIEDSKSDPSIKGIIITGHGDKAFVAGADIRELKGITPDKAKIFAEKGQKVFHLIENHTKPVIAAINGFALGGGCELAMACHLRIAVSSSKFGQPEVNLGLIPGYGGTQRLTQLVGKGKALELIMTADLIDSAEALSLGLVNKVVGSHADLMPESISVMKKILSKSPFAIGMVIQSVNSFFKPQQNGYQEEAINFSACTNTEDFAEGIDAFLAKRSPKFTGK